MCGSYAARMMVPTRRGLIINVSSFGGVSYLLNVAYGVGKAGVSLLNDAKSYL